MAIKTKNGKVETARTWTCEFCRATNVHGPVCGCAESRKRAGRELKLSGSEVWF